MENEMTSQWQVELDDAWRQTETSRGFPARPAAAIVILVALMVIDATPRMALDAEFIEQPRTEQRAPSACGAEAVARAQREVNRTRQPSPSAFS
jgi:cell division protein ZapA (FtsZ GTPase activity inhibitor)